MFHGFSMYLNGSLDNGVFFCLILGLNLCLPCVFGVLFSVVFGRYIDGCLTLVWLLFVYQNDRKS